MFSFFKKEKQSTQREEAIEEVDYEDIKPISDYFHKETGIIFDSQMSILKSKVIAFCKQNKINSFKKLLVDVKRIEDIKQKLIDHLTTNETYFYRELKQIMDLVQDVKKSNVKVDILCAPSSTGEEPYSIAIALLEAGVPASNFKILGIDINSDAIAKSIDAKYGARHIRNLSPQVISKYFKEENAKYILNENIKSLVSFKVVNLFDESLRTIGTFDFIFSRNMLIYFDKETKLKAKSILEGLRKNEIHDVFFGHADLF